MTRRMVIRGGLVIVFALPIVRLGYRNYARWILPEGVVLFLAAGVLVISSLWWLRADWRRLRPGWRFLPALLTLLAPVVSIWLGSAIEKADFRLRRQVHYKEVVRMIERHEIAATSDGNALEMPTQYASDALWVEPAPYGLQQLRVEFGWTRHRSYVYCKEESCVADSRWSSQRRLDRDWLIVTR